MRRYDLFILVTFVFLFILLSSRSVGASVPLVGKLIVVDAGHGGLDPGTLSGEILEKDLNLDIALLLELELSKMGASVILTRDGDYDLSSPNTTLRKRSDFDNRILLINESSADLYLSIHMNFLNDSSYSGPQVFYDSDNLGLADVIQNTLNNELGSSRSVKSIPDSTYMYKQLNIPGVLIECGFLSNANERYKLTTEDYQKKIAELIADAISKYY